MGRSYNLKGSPINRGTAAKPSPAKALPVGALIGLGTMLLGKGISAYQQYKGGKKAKELALMEKKSDALDKTKMKPVESSPITFQKWESGGGVASGASTFATSFKEGFGGALGSAAANAVIGGAADILTSKLTKKKEEKKTVNPTEGFANIKIGNSKNT